MASRGQSARKYAQRGVTLEVKRRPSGDSYVLRWWDPRAQKKRSESVGRVDEVTLREAKKARELKAAEFHHKPQRRTMGPTLRDWLTVYERQRKAEGRSRQTLLMDGFVGKLLKHHFGEDTPLGTITREDARAFVTAMYAGELDHLNASTRGRAKDEEGDLGPPPAPGEQTRARHLRTIQTLFNRAVDDDLIEGNPFARMEKAKPAADESWRYVSAAEFWALYHVVPDEWKKLITLARLAALTRTDALELSWSQVHLAEAEIRIKRDKTGQVQHAPMDKTLVGLMRQWQRNRQTLRIEAADRVLDRRQMYLGNLGRSFDGWCRKAGIEPYGKPLHTLRKSCILDWARSGVTAAVLTLWAGHSDIQTTLKYYDKVREEDMAPGKAGRLIGPVKKLPPKTAPRGSQKKNQTRKLEAS